MIAPALPPSNDSIAQDAQFHDEFIRFLDARRALRRYMPTPDCFPLMCAMVEAAKKYYVSLPRAQRYTMRYIPFLHTNREWFLRRTFNGVPRAREVFLDICCDTRAVMVTVAVAFDNDMLEAKGDA